MAGHIDISHIVPADLDSTWRIANDPAHLQKRNVKVVAVDKQRHAVTLWIVAAPPEGGQIWEYYVERIEDPQRKTVYARRWGAPGFTYSYALWHYQYLSACQTRIRCVQDFELRTCSRISEPQMERTIGAATEASLRSEADSIAASVHAFETHGE